MMKSSRRAPVISLAFRMYVFRDAKDVLDQLLRHCARAALDFAFLVISFERVLNAVHVDAVVLEKVSVFSGNYARLQAVGMSSEDTQSSSSPSAAGRGPVRRVKRDCPSAS